MSCKLVYGKGKIGPFFVFSGCHLWLQCGISAMAWSGRKPCLVRCSWCFPHIVISVFFSLKNKNSYFEWCILRSQSVQLSCWIRAIQDHFSDRNRLNRSKPRGRDLSDVVPLTFNQGLSLIESHSMKVKICFQDHPLFLFFWCLVADVLKIS